MKVLIDMNLSPAWARVFEAQGIQAVHWSAVGQRDASDTAKPSVVQVRYPNINPDKVGDWLVGLILRHREPLLQGALLAIEPGQHRVRLLPLNE